MANETATAPAANANAEQPFFAQGIPVEVGKVQRELKKLWQDSHETATRASRLNLVIFSAAEHSLRANTALVERISRQHALRAILIAAKPQKDSGDRVRAWVNAHCQISKSGAKQRCSEQIAFQLEGAARDQGLIPNIVLSHLDGDLPLYFWRQGEFSPAPDPRLLSWVDRLLFDSAEWTDPAKQFAILEKLAADAGLENALGDLNWGRLTGLRVAIAQFFDAGAERLTEVAVTHAPGSRLTAHLLVGWLGAQLGWEAKDGLKFAAAEGTEVAVKFAERAGPRIARVEIRTASGNEFAISRDGGSDYYTASAKTAGREQRQLLPVGAEDLAALVSAELAYGGEHRCYRKALRLVVESQRAMEG